MNNPSTVLIAEDDDGHAFLIEDGLRQGGVIAPFIRFNDGQEVLDFLFEKTLFPRFESEQSYVLLLDIRMPKIDGIEVLRQVKADIKFHKLPIIMLTTSDDLQEIEKCHELGCNNYIQKPGSFENFSSAVKTLGRFLSLSQFPSLAQSG